MTPETAISIIEAVAAGEKVATVADRLGVERRTARRLCKIVGLAVSGRKERPAGLGNNKPNPRLPEILEMIKAGVAGSDIARDVGLTRERIRQIARKHSLTMTLRQTRKLLASRAAATARKAAKAEKWQESRDYYATLAAKIKELREAGYSWTLVGATIGMPTMSALKICLARYPELRERAYKPRQTRRMTHSEQRCG